MTEQPLIVPISTTKYVLVKEYAYSWEVGRTIFKMTIGKGFIFDGASVPRIAWTLSGIRPDGLIRAAALVHDWLYAHQGKLPVGSVQIQFPDLFGWDVALGVWTRKEADRMFARIMRECEVEKKQRRKAYWAVRLFGWIAWSK